MDCKQVVLLHPEGFKGQCNPSRPAARIGAARKPFISMRQAQIFLGSEVRSMRIFTFAKQRTRGCRSQDRSATESGREEWGEGWAWSKSPGSYWLARACPLLLGPHPPVLLGDQPKQRIKEASMATHYSSGQVRVGGGGSSSPWGPLSPVSKEPPLFLPPLTVEGFAF